MSGGDQNGLAIDAALRSLALDPAGPAAWVVVAGASAAAGRVDEALAAYREASRLDPADLDVATRLAHAAVEAGRAEIELARQAAATPPTPESLMIRLHLLRHLERDDDAARVAGDLVALVPESAVAAAHLADCLFAKAADRQAEEALRRALALNPGDTGLRTKLGRTLLRTGQPAAARDAFELCLAAADERCRLDLALASLQLGCQTEALRHAEAALDDGDRASEARRLLATISAYAPDIGGAALTEIIRRAATGPTPETHASPATDRDPDRRIRLGFLGGAFWKHPSSWLTLRGIEALDPAQFEIHCFSPDLVADDFTSRWKKLATRWHSLERRDDDAVAAMIRASRIDVLIDLGGCLNIGRLDVLRHRAAPVQVKWVGAQFHTTALPAVDWFVSDPYETPLSLAALYTERLLLLRRSYVCYDPPGDAPGVGTLPADANGFVTFGSFNSLMKITPQVLDTWSRILHEVAGARLLLKAPAFDEEATATRIVGDFVRRGVDPDRIAIAGESDHRAMLDAYRTVDIALQPFPYCGGVSLLEALWMGVPSIALSGESFAARHGVTHLSNVGLADHVAADPENYVAKAASLARDGAKLRALRATLRRRLAQSPICDAKLFAADFSMLLRTAWRDYCASEREQRDTPPSRVER